MAHTTAPARKFSRRDAKPGATFIWTMGYSPVAAFAGEFTGKDGDTYTYRYTWVLPGTGDNVGVVETISAKDLSEAIRVGWVQFREDFNPQTGKLGSRAMTEAEVAEAKEQEAAWERFTQSETYMCM